MDKTVIILIDAVSCDVELIFCSCETHILHGSCDTRAFDIDVCHACIANVVLVDGEGTVHCSYFHDMKEIHDIIRAKFIRQILSHTIYKTTLKRERKKTLSRLSASS